MSVSQKVLDAIELLATSSVKKAGYDKTIQAQILSCEDATIGKYRCRYQDSVFYAYSNNSNMTFTNGSYVYILVPENDMSKEKTILGSTKKLGINYISQLEQDQIYNVNGTNCVTSNEVYYLDSNNKYYMYDIYNYENNLNNVTLDIEALEHYIKQSSSLLVGATFRTQIPPARQYRGHYGIAFNLRFQDNTSNQQVVRTYIIDEDNMIDNPYRLIHDTRQYQVFDIDGSNFIRVQSIEIFNKDFLNAEGNITTGILNDGDIIISNLEISAAERMAENEINGVAISFYTPQGTFFTESSTSASYKTIIAQVKVKGKLVSASQMIPFYWGRENVGVAPSSQYYNKYLGRGWQCLNDKNIIEEATATTDPVIEWVAGNDTYILNFNQATARDNKFKVAIIYDGNVITKEINIQNLVASMPIITIESDGGTKFYYDIGHPNLTCKVNGGEPVGYTYYWAYESNAGVFTDLPETTSLNTDYADAVTALASLQAELGVTKFPNAEAENLSNLTAAVKAYNFIQRVQGNKVYDVQIKNITNFGIFKCSVYNAQDIYLGTASITLTNSLEGEDLYSLVINNGSETFQYNENGVAPNSKSLDVQQAIQALTFTVYDNLGNPLNDEIVNNVNNCKIRWGFPITDTMLVDQEENGQATGIDENYKYYDNLSILTYNIAQKYDVRKQRNQIKLTIDYKGISLTAETNFTFVKQGEPGTNGTEYVVKLIPNTQMDNPPLWPMITKAGSDYIVNYGINSTANETVIRINTDYKLFKAQLWHSGDLVWEGFSATDTATDNITKPSVVHWQVLKNKYNSTTADESAFNIENEISTTGDIQYTGDHLQSALNTPLANIIKCSITWENKLYYATIPIITAWTYSENYRVNLKEYTGFRYVVYSADGMFPQYDNSHPFEFIINQKINSIWEDVSNASGSYAIEYIPGACGNTKNTQSKETVNANLLTILDDNTIYREGLLDNQWQYRPASTYSGECVNQAVICTYLQNGTIVGKINIPIHFLLNKYGLANLNGWDGNSIQINSQGGYILSPQIGAGVKNNDNSFTGILMGEVKTPTKNTPDIGILGYNSGNRTIFLNSANGSALFGKKGNGQIILDPSANRALLYSDKFWKTYDEETGLPTSYVYKDEHGEAAGNNNGQGLLIDLTEPEIRFGSGSFIVNDNGVHIRIGNGKTIDKTVQDLEGAISGISELTDGALLSDTIHYLASSISDPDEIDITSEDWDVDTELTSENKYLWCYHTYVKVDKDASGGTTEVNSTPIIIGVYGDQGQLGPTGADGRDAEWFYGTTAPTTISEAIVGSMYLNTVTSEMYKCTDIINNNQIWTYIGNLSDSIKVGGRNLILNSRVFDLNKIPYTNSNTSICAEQSQLDGINYYYCSGQKYFNIDFPVLNDNEQYTLSFDLAGSAQSNAQSVFVKINNSETNIGNILIRTWKRFSITFTANNTTNAQIRVAENSSSINNEYFAAICNIKLEQGNVATDWSIAPEENVISTTPIYYVQSADSINLTGDIVSFDNAENKNAIQSLIVNLNVMQDGSGRTSPTNRRNLLPYSNINITQIGYNIWDEQWIYTENQIESANFIPVFPNTKYYCCSPNNIILKFYDAEQNYINDKTEGIGEFTTPNNCKYLKFQVDSTYGSVYNNDISINYPSTDSNYHHYMKTNYSIALGSSYYSGSFDAITGIFTANRELKVYTGDESEEWTLNGVSTDNSLRIPISTTYKHDQLIYCNILQGVENTTSINMQSFSCCIAPSSQDYYLLVELDAPTTPSEWKTQLANTHMEVLYELKTPIEIQLTATEIQTLVGQNNIYSDQGSIEITYNAIPEMPSWPTSGPTLENEFIYNTWTPISPKYDINYLYYYTCYERLYEDGHYDWSNVVFDQSFRENTLTLQDAILNTTPLYYATGLIYNTISQNASTIASFKNVDDEESIEHINITIPKAIQAGSGNPTPGHINVWNEQWEVGAIDINTGQLYTQSNSIRSQDFIKVMPNTAYYCYTQTGLNILFYNKNQEWLENYQYISNSEVFTTPNNCIYIKFSTNNTYGDSYQNNISINYPSTYSTYQSFLGNNRSIIGTSSIDLNITGINVWDEQWEPGQLNNAGEPIEDEPNEYHIRSRNFISVAPNQQYYNVGYTLLICEYDKYYSYVRTKSSVATGTFTISNDTYYIKIVAPISSYEEGINQISINYPATNTLYHKYHNNSFINKINLDFSCYGGDWDAISGQYIKDYEYLELDGSADENWRIEGQGTNTQKFIIPLKLPANIIELDVFSNRFIYTSSSNESQEWGKIGIGTNLIIYDKDNIFTTDETSLTSTLYKFQEWLRQNPVQICYKLANSEILHLNPMVLINIMGHNNIWTHSGNFKITYLSEPNIPDAPTAHIENYSSDYNVWTTTVPKYNINYPYYFICYEYIMGSGNYKWSKVLLDEATTGNIKNFRRQSNRLGYIYDSIASQQIIERDHLTNLVTANYKTLQGLKQATASTNLTLENFQIAFNKVNENLENSFTFNSDATLDIKAGKSQIYTHIGADTYQFQNKDTKEPIFIIDQDGTTGKRADVIGQIGIGTGGVGQSSYIEQWSIRKGTNQNENNPSAGPKYDLQIVWVGG